MRTLSANAITELASKERVVEASLTIRDERLRFADQRGTQVDYLSGDTVLAYDDCVYSTNILRIAVVKDGSDYEIWYNYIDDFESVWDNWTDTTFRVAENSRPAVYGGRLVFLQPDGYLKYSDWNGTVWSAASTIEDTAETPCADIAMVSTDIFYMHYTPGSTSNHGFIIRKSVSGAFSDMPWSGRTTGANFYGAFDAVAHGTDTEYVYFSDHDGSRAWGMRVDVAGIYGRPFPVVPLDIVDDTSKFIMGHASVINSEVFVTGILKRPGGHSMHIYMKGPERFSIGRDMFIAQANDDTQMYTYGDETTIEYDPIPGQIHHVNTDEVWYLGPLLAWMAPATQYVGYDNTALETTVTEFWQLNLGDAGNRSKKLSFSLDPNTSHAAIREGSVVEVTATINSEDIDMGTFVIDAVHSDEFDAGSAVSVIARSRAAKTLDNWTSDADFDFWGQTAVASRPYDLTEVIRAEGIWEQETVAEGNVIALPYLNTQGILYSSAHSGMGTVAQGMFYYPDDAEFEPSYGVICNYSHQKWEATGLELHENTSRMGHWGIGVIFELDAHSSAPGVRVTHFYEDSVEDITTFSLSIPADTWHWLRARYEFGHLLIDYRLDDTPEWTNIGELIICYDSEDSTYHGLTVETATLTTDEETERGRAALYIKNITGHSPSYGLSSSGLILGVDDNDFASATDYLLIDREIVQVDSKSANTTPSSNLDVVEGFTFPTADHWDSDPTGFTGYEIYIDGNGTAGRTAFDDHALVVVSGPGEGRTFTISEYDKIAPTQWTDTGGPYTAPDKWTDHVDDLSYGSWTASGMQRIFVTENPSGAISEGSVVRIVPAFTIARGELSTDATTHIAGINASLYKDLTVYCRDFNYFTTEPEYSIADMAAEITGKAGAGSVSASNRLSNQAKATSGWDVQNEVALTEQEARSFVAHFELNDPDTAGGFGVAFALLKDDVGTYSDGRVMMIYQDKIEYMEYNTTPQLIERYNLDFTYADGPSTISVHDEFISVYIHDKHIHTFVDRDSAIVQADEVVPLPQWYAGVVLHNTCDVDPLWTEVSQRCDNYVLNMGARGGSLLSRLIGEKRIYFTDDMAGELRMFTDHVTINSGSAVDFLMDQTTRASEESLFTRVRIEGMEVSEQFDTDAIIEHGNLFALANTSELIEYDDHYREALNLLEDATYQASPIAITGLADPRVEANDIFIVNDGSDKTVIVDSVQFAMNVTPENVHFVMNIEGRDGS